MSVRATQEVWQRSAATGNARLVLVALAYLADHDGRCSVHANLLEQMTRLTQEELRTATFELGRLGEMELDVCDLGLTFALKVGEFA